MARRTEELVTFALSRGIAWIGLNRLAKRNAVNDALLAALGAAVDLAATKAKAAVLFGEGEHFCAGLDLAAHAGKSATDALETSRRWHATFDKIARGPVPFVSILQGAVVGGGLELAAATHIRIADETAFFQLPEGSRGLFVGGGGSARIARLIGVARMTDMMLTGRILSVQEASAANLVQYVVARGAASAKAKELAGMIASNAPLSNYAILQALPRIQDMAEGDGLFVESLMSAFTQTSPEAKTRIEAFFKEREARKLKPIRKK